MLTKPHFLKLLQLISIWGRNDKKTWNETVIL